MAKPPPPVIPTPPAEPPFTPVVQNCRIGLGSALLLYGFTMLIILATGWGELTDLRTRATKIKDAQDTAKKENIPLEALLADDRCCWSWPRLLSQSEPETRLLVIVILCSAIGSFIHTCTSFADYVGNQKLAASWLWWYLDRPIIGVGIGLLTYFTYRTGMISGSSNASVLNPFGIAAIAGLAGMFSKKAADALSTLFDTMIKTPNAGDEVRKNALSKEQDKERELLAKQELKKQERASTK